MFNNLTKLLDVVFKSLGIVVMVFTITVVIISVKSCSSTMNAIDQSEHNITRG